MNDDRLTPSADARDRVPDAPLDNTYWKLVGIAADAYSHNTDNREPRIRFVEQDGRVSGFTGCNKFFGSYETSGGGLQLGEIAVTQMACIDGMDIEQRYMQALNKVNRFQISGDTLQLLGDNGVELEFEAVYLF